ncbi:MAG: hypothetical protein ACI4WT_04285 [Oligosphaeraceae bacterium]
MPMPESQKDITAAKNGERHEAYGNETRLFRSEEFQPLARLTQFGNL